MNNAIINILISGVGGQGTVLAGKLLAHCALAGGCFVRSAETIGMAQRGGSVLGHVRVCADEDTSLLTSPLIPRGQAQLLIGFEPAETLKAYALCSAKSLVVTATAPLLPPTASLQRLNYDGKAQIAALEQQRSEGHIAALITVDNNDVLGKLGFDQALNVVLLGAALAALEVSVIDAPMLSYSAMQRTIEETIKQKFIEPNLQALEIGYQLVCA